MTSSGDSGGDVAGAAVPGAAVSSTDVPTGGGRSIRVYDSGPPDAALTVVWHHGSPQTGRLLEPLLTAAVPRGIRFVSYARPGYEGSTPNPGRDVASAAHDVECLADALGLTAFAVMGASGGGPHALACAALLPGRVVAAVTLAGIAPIDAAGLDFFAGMADPSGLRAAQRGVDARRQHEQTAQFDPSSFVERDYAALDARRASLGADVARATAVGAAADGTPDESEAAQAAVVDALVDDDVAFAGSWGFDVASIAGPVLLVQGGCDRVVPPAHALWMLDALPNAELWLRPLDGHISVLDAIPVALDWLSART